MTSPYPKPTAGDVVLCKFPQDLRSPSPGPKSRPAIILKVFEPAASAPATFRVQVCYATTNRQRLFDHEFEITRAGHAVEFESAGLSGDTKFDLLQSVLVPYDSDWFELPNFPQYGPVPKLGILHPLSVPRLLRAQRAAERLR
ncbi:hypothetical protein E4T66_17460 [Sinimarinibacterium sp. CAU 1509]|nr:hypothetical protein E4T66_17460 [Sinimarinibacterium sp. CAU 1509]